MSEKISRIYSEKPVSSLVNEAANNFEQAMNIAIEEAKSSGLPQGILVGMLHAYAADQTLRLINIRDAFFE